MAIDDSSPIGQRAEQYANQLLGGGGSVGVVALGPVAGDLSQLVRTLLKRAFVIGYAAGVEDAGRPRRVR